MEAGVKILDIRQHKTVIPERRGKGDSAIAEIHLKEVTRTMVQ